MLLLHWHSVPARCVVIGFFNEAKEIPLKKNQSGFFLEEEAVLITVLCKQFLSVFVIFEDVQAVTEGFCWADLSYAML